LHTVAAGAGSFEPAPVFDLWPGVERHRIFHRGLTFPSFVLRCPDFQRGESSGTRTASSENSWFAVLSSGYCPGIHDERNDDTAVYFGLFGWPPFVFPEVRLYPSAEIREVAAFGLRIDVRFCGWYIAGRICGFDGLRVGAFSSERTARDSCPEMSVIRNLCGVKPNARNQTPSRAYTKWIPSSVLCRHDRQCGTGTTFRGGRRFLSRNGSHRINMGGSAGRTFGNRPPPAMIRRPFPDTNHHLLWRINPYLIREPLCSSRSVCLSGFVFVRCLMLCAE